MNGLKKGDVVVVNSGGPKMTIDDIAADGKFICTWFDGNGVLQRDSFPATSLEKFVPPKPVDLNQGARLVNPGRYLER